MAVYNGVAQGGLNPNVNVQIQRRPWGRSLFNGPAQISVQSIREAGGIKWTASADGLMPATVTLTTQPCRPPPWLP